MKKIILILLLTSSMLFAQTEKQTFGIAFSGFVKTDLLFDSRQTESFREGHFLLYPANEKLDTNGVDINANSAFNMLAIQTRLVGKISGPDAFGAKTSGLIEAEFFGTSDADIHGFRLRHAYTKFDWEKTSLLVGQTWHPMFVTEMFPGVVSFNTGAPFQPFSRNPQVKLTYTLNHLKLIGVAASQRDFSSSGPAGVSGSYLRNSLVPNLHAQLQYAQNGHLLGAGIDYKRLEPRLVSTKNVKTDQTVNAISYMGYAKINLQPVVVKLEGVYGGNLADHLMLGGYAIKSKDASSGIEAYTAINCMSAWGELTIGSKVEGAVFAGYAQNLGAQDNLSGSSYGRGLNIASIWRVAPRVQINSGKSRISAELEYTAADYGKANSLNKGKVENVKNIANLRLLAAFYYFF